MKKHVIKLQVKTKKQLNQLIECNTCKNKTEYKKLYFYIDESNISITKNSRGICKECYLTIKNKIK